jgi:hypothetical protein
VLILIEGCDQTGKTTLANAIQQYALPQKSRMIHAGKPEGHPLTAYEGPINSYEPGFTDPIIIDRWHLGEAVWPTIFKRETELDAASFRHIELFLQSRGAVLVLAEGRETLLTERFASAAQAGHPEPMSPNWIPFVLSLFKTLGANTVLPFYPFDTERDPYEKFIPPVVGVARYFADRTSTVFEHFGSEWIGSFEPDVLFVGERPGNGPQADKLPFAANVPFVPFKTTSGWYLMQALPTNPVAIANAFQNDGSSSKLNELYEILNYPNVVALGNVAHDELDKARIKHGVAAHPQYVRRFKQSKLGEYTALLAEASMGKDTRGEL